MPVLSKAEQNAELDTKAEALLLYLKKGLCALDSSIMYDLSLFHILVKIDSSPFHLFIWNKGPSPVPTCYT